MYCTRTRWCVQGAVGHQPQRKGTADRYVSDLVENYPSAVKNSTQVPTAVQVYRKALAASPDGSVRIASIGITTNMRDLVQSAADEHSPLDGRALIAQKVAEIVWMDGMCALSLVSRSTANSLPGTRCTRQLFRLEHLGDRR